MSTSVLPWRFKSPPVVNYGIAVLSAVAAVAGGLAYDHFLAVGPSVSLFLCAIMFVAWAAGTGPALLATAVTILAFEWFFLQPAYSFIPQFKNLPRLGLFVVTALFVVALSAAQRRAEVSLRRARDEQASTVQELQRLNEKLRHENAERKRAEEKASQAGRALQATIDTIPALVSRYGPDGRRDFVNAAWKRFTGLSQEDALGTEWSSTVHPDDIAMGEIRWREAMAKGEALHMEQRFRRADGIYRWFLVDRVPLHDESGTVIKWYSTGYDIEDRKQAEGALRRSEARLAKAERELRLTLNSIPTLAWQTRADGFAEYLNKRWLDYTGLSLEQALGWEWQAAVHPEDLARLVVAGEKCWHPRSPPKSRHGCGVSTESIAGSCFGRSRCAMKPERSSGGMERIRISRTGSGPRARSSAARPIWPRRRSSASPAASAG